MNPGKYEDPKLCMHNLFSCVSLLPFRESPLLWQGKQSSKGWLDKMHKQLGLFQAQSAHASPHTA